MLSAQGSKILLFWAAFCCAKIRLFALRRLTRLIPTFATYGCSLRDCLRQVLQSLPQKVCIKLYLAICLKNNFRGVQFVCVKQFFLIQKADKFLLKKLTFEQNKSVKITIFQIFSAINSNQQLRRKC